MEDKNELIYAVAVAERYATTSNVVSVKCLFGDYHGRGETNVNTNDRKRARMSNSKYFRAPFRVDNIKFHLRSQHKDKWEAYSALGEEDKKLLFDSITPIRNTLRAHFEGEKELLFSVEQNIFSARIGDLLFDPEANNAEEELGTALCLFTDLENSESDGDGEDEDTYYTI